MKFEISKHIASQVNKYYEAENFKDGVNCRDEETFTYTISFIQELKIKFEIKNILIGVIIGIISTTFIFLLMGDVDIQTDFQFGEKLDQDDKDIRISIEKNIDENNQEIIIVDAIGKGSVTMEDIENELGRVFTEQNIDASAGIIKYYITLDDESNFK